MDCDCVNNNLFCLLSIVKSRRVCVILQNLMHCTESCHSSDRIVYSCDLLHGKWSSCNALEALPKFQTIDIITMYEMMCSFWSCAFLYFVGFCSSCFCIR